MHLCEVRRFMRNFIVYVNNDTDIKIFKNDKRFHTHATYYSKSCLMGIEFSFKCSATTIIGANKYVDNILKKERKTYERLQKLPIIRKKNKK